MATSDSLSYLLDKLTSQKSQVARSNRYYNAERTLSNLGVALPRELHAFHTTIAWCRLVVTVYEERLDLSEIRVPGDDVSTDRYQSWAALNNLHQKASLAHTEALATGRAYIVVGARDANTSMPDVPLFTVESASNMYADIDPRTGEVTSAIRLYGGDNDQRATLYLPNSTHYLMREKTGGWVSDPRIPDRTHNYGIVPVVPLVNRARIDEPLGRPEFQDIIGLTDAAARTLTNLQGAQELLAVPARILFGVSPDEFQDEEGNQTNPMEAYYGSVLGLANPEGKAMEFSGAQLANFTSTLMSYAREVASISGIPLSYLGVASEANPSSGDAIRADESRLIKRAERIAREFGPAWEMAFRIGALIVDGEMRPELATTEAVWRDPATNTKAALADAAVKLYVARNDEGPLFPREFIWRYLGLTAEERGELAGMFEESAITQLLSTPETP